MCDDLVLGIDGGATKTVAWLAPKNATGDKSVVGRGTAGPANFQSTNIEAALANLDSAVDRAFADASIKPQPVAAAVIGLAGSDRPENRTVVERWAAHRTLADRVRLVHDALPVLAAGTPRGWGIALIAGTGSLCYGQSQDGRTARSGGWGYLFGDEGSAYWLALAGLRAAAQAADGRGPRTDILPRLLKRLDIAQSADLVPSVYGMSTDRAAIASLAEEVSVAAEGGDCVAQHILDGAAVELAAMIRAVAERLELAAAPFPLALTGGLLLGCTGLRTGLEAVLQKAGLATDPVTLVTEPVAGAVRLARAEA